MSYDSIEKKREYARQYYHDKLKARLAIAKVQKKELVDIDIVNSYLAGLSTLKLSDEYGVDKTIIRRILLKNNVKLRDNKKLCEDRNGINNPNYTGYEGIIGTKWRAIVNSSKKRGLEFSITIEEAWKQYIDQNGKCALSGLDIIFAKNVKEQVSGICTASLDRIDSNKGYIINNIQWVYQEVNRMKWDMKEEDFIKLCSTIAIYNKGDSHQF